MIEIVKIDLDIRRTLKNKMHHYDKHQRKKKVICLYKIMSHAKMFCSMKQSTEKSDKYPKS